MSVSINGVSENAILPGSQESDNDQIFASLMGAIVTGELVATLTGDRSIKAIDQMLEESKQMLKRAGGA
jgi:hypothetical protein